jgi:hypothetical protein
MSTISGQTIKGEVYLNGTSGKYIFASPLTITSTGAIEPGSASEAIYAEGSTPWTVVNFGIVTVNGNAALRARGAAGVVVNFGTMDSAMNSGIQLYNGGTVINSGKGLIDAPVGVYITGTSGVVSNSATIAGSVLGLSIIDGAVVTNTGLITAGGAGVDFYAEGAGTVINSGRIIGKGTSGDSFQNIAGIELKGGGIVTNSGSGLIRGNIGVYVNGAVGTVTNSGSIIGIASQGVDLNAGGTVVDSGLIRGAHGHPAVTLGGTGDNLLVLEHGYVLQGGVSVTGTANTLELLGAAGAVTVNFDKANAGFTSFGTVAFGAPNGNNETLTITNNTALPGTISDFTQPDEIVDLTKLKNGTIVGGGTVNGSDQLVVSSGSHTVTLQLDPSENYSGIIWQTAPDSGTGTDISIACFCRGTLILTPGGDMPVERLAIGDMVLTAAGVARQIKWIGRRSYARRFAYGQRHILPICIGAGALADGIPSRDLWLSPNHALYLEGVLVEARDLVNGASISQPPPDRAIEYFHIELDSHDLLVAEGAVAESYIDDGNRLLFHNAPEYWAFYPDAADGPEQYCAPRLAEGHTVERIRAAIDRRARLKVAADATAIRRVQ